MPRKNFGEMPYGRLPTLPVAAVAHPSVLSTSNNKKRCTESLRRKDGCAVRAIQSYLKKTTFDGLLSQLDIEKT